ncbi:rod shape-determining protein RodA [Prochlorothrix hollandica]|uniref:rod shape-determining protein RodA n=1 Tax=Prochlorothrix hollandica TaxID=1223 RepID=UPI00333FF735
MRTRSRPAPNRLQFLFTPWQEIDGLLLVLTIALTILGGVMIRSTELNYGWTDWWQHWLVGAVGLILTLILARMRYEYFLQWQWFIYGATCLSLVAVKVVGTSALGAQRWITIGGFNIQPSEFAKLGAIIVLAASLSTYTASTLSGFFRALLIIALPWGLVFVQPDLGTSLVFGAVSLVMLYWANANPGWLLIMGSPLISAILFSRYLPAWFAWLALISLIAWKTLPWAQLAGLVTLVGNLVAGGLGNWFWFNLLKDYQRDRLILFMDPDRDPLGGGYHLIQSRIAIGAGELWGRGLHHGTQTQLNFIPEQHTDFIFSAIGEELGFIGSLVVLLVFWLICLRLVIIAQNAKDNFGSLLAIGVLGMLVFQVVVNVGMTIGLAPVTGIPLPWLSYGRSAMLTNFMAIGLVESVANHRHRPKF